MSSQDTDFSCPDPNRLGGWWQTDIRGRLVRSASGQRMFKPEAEFELMVIESCDVKRGYEQLVDQEDSILLDELLDEYEKDKHVEKWSTLKAINENDQPRRASKRELVGQLIRGVALIADEATRSRDKRRAERNKPSEPSPPSRGRRIFNWFQSLPKGTNSKQSGTLAQPVKKGRVEENIKVAESKARGEPFKSPRAGFKNGEHSRSQKRSFNDQRRNSETSPKQGSHFERRRDDDRRERRDRDRSRSSGGGGISAQNGLPKINCLPESGVHQLDQFPDAQIKHWDYGYRTPEGLARLEQLEALVAEDQLNAPEPDLPIDRIWRKDNQDENSTYASYRKTRVDPGAFGSYDPLGLGSEDGGAQFEPTIKVEQPTPVKSTGCADSSQQLSELEQKRRIDEEYERLKREPKKEAAVSRVEAREQERRERAQRETREFRRTMIDKKVIDESRKLRKELKDYDIVGSILMPQTARRLQSRPVEDDVIDETNYYCRTCHVRSIGREERDRHDDSDEHKAEVRRLENLEVDRRIEADKKYNEQVKRGQLPETRTPAEIFDHKPIRPPSPRTPPEYNNGAPSPCHSNAPSVESDDDLPPPVPKPEPFRPPSDGMAKVIYLLDQKETLTVDAILNVNSLQIASEKEAQVAKELLRLLDGSMFAFADKLIPNDVRDMMQEKGLLRSKTS